MKGVILTNPYDNSVTQSRKVLRMTQEFERLGVEISTYTNDHFFACIRSGKPFATLQADFVLYFDKDKYVAQLLEQNGTRLFNKAKATAICDDKMQTHIELSKHGIPMPDTMAGALCYVKDGKVSERYLNQVAETLGLPVVVKQCYGSFGEQVYLAKTQKELFDIVNSIKGTAYLFQRFVEKSSGRDMRVIVVGGKALCAIIRMSKTDFRSNIEHGGVATACEIPKEVASLCEQAAKIIDLDYCGIDVLLGDEPQICEVNSNAMFYAMEQATGVNVAKAYAEHIVKCVKQ